MNNFDRRQLRYFVAVAEDLHFGHAAQRLHLSQPSLSQQIVALEKDLGFKLFNRTRRSVELTVAGQQFFHDARNILAEMVNAATRARDADDGRTGTLRIGMNYSAPFHPAPTEIFRDFAAHYPGIRLELLQETGGRQLDRLHRHTLDISFVFPTQDDLSPELVFLPLGRDEVRFVVGAGHRLAKKERLAAADLRGENIYLMGWQKRTAFYKALNAACHAQGFEPEPQTHIEQMPFVMSIVAATQGLSFMPSFLERIKPEGILFKNASFLPQASRAMPLCLAYRAKDKTPALGHFIAHAKATITRQK